MPTSRQGGDGAMARGVAAEPPMHHQPLGNVVADPHQRVQRRHRVLEHHADAVAAHPAHRRLVQREEVAPLEHRAARHDPPRWIDQPHQRVGDGRFAGARFADQPDDLARRQIEARAVDGDQRVIAPAAAAGVVDGQAGDRQERFGHVASLGLRASRSQSPSRLTPSTSSTSAAPGSTEIHQ